MKLAISYFYKIRFFQPWMIPISTAAWDPKYYHDNKGKDYLFIDKRGVINGYRYEALAPGPDCVGLCGGPSQCSSDPSTCKFLSVYRRQLEKIDFDEFIHNLQALETALKARDSSLPQDLIFVLMVYEPPYKACSERGSIQDWVRSHGWECDELIDFT